MSINEALLPCPFCGSAGNAEDGFAPLESIVYAYCSNPHCLLHDIDIGFSPHEWNARSQAPAPAWVAVSERLPEVDEQVWVALRFPDGSTDQGYAIWTGVDWFLDVSESGSLIARQEAIQQGLDAADVTHWMKLPEPPLPPPPQAEEKSNG